MHDVQLQPPSPSRGHARRRVFARRPPTALIRALSRRDSPTDRANRDADTPAESAATGEGFSEGCCSWPGRIPRRSAAVLRKAKRAEYTPSQRRKQGSDSALRTPAVSEILD